MKKLLILLGIILLIPSLTFAGDYKTFILGESEEVTAQKFITLAKNGDIKLKNNSLYTTILNYDVEIYPGFFDKKLFSIELYFPKSSMSANVEYMIEDEIKPMFIQLYGKPTREYEYPNILDLSPGYLGYCYQWILPNKTIILGVTKDAESNAQTCGAEIMILDNKLAKAKEERKSKILGESGKDF